MRFTANAMRVKGGELVSFDSAKHTIGVEYNTASGSLFSFWNDRVDVE